MDDPFITSLEFSVILHIGTLARAAPLLPLRLAAARAAVPGHAFATARWPATRTAVSRCSWPSRRFPPCVLGFLLHDLEDVIREQVGLVAVMLVVGAAILWLAERPGARRKMAARSDRSARRSAIGGAQALALIPGISRSGISISAGLFAGLEREEAARFSFLMATPITAAAAAYEVLKVVRGEGVAIAGRSAGGRADRVLRLRHARDRGPAPLPADPLDRRLRRLPARPGRDRRLRPLARLSADRPARPARGLDRWRS